MALMTKVKQLLGSRDALVRQLADMEAKHAAAGQARADAIEQAEIERAKIIEILERPERLRAAALGVSMAEQAELGAIENALRAAPSRELSRFEAFVGRLYSRARMEPPPSVEEEVHRITRERRMVNLPEIERHLALAPVLVRVRVTLRDELWRLPDDRLQARLAELRAELERAVEGTVFQSEVA